jgi:hypothetical protein
MEDMPIEIERIRDSEKLRAWRHVGYSKRLVLCFSGLGKNQSQPPGYEFASIATGGGADHVLYIADPNRSWLNEPGFLEETLDLIKETMADIGAEQVVALGHSMGGFSACVIPYFIPVDYVLALSPQVSIHPEVVPDDGRWMQHRENVDDIEIVDVGSYLEDRTQYVVVFGRHGREAPQRSRFPNPDNLTLFVMPQTNHNTAARLKSLGLLTDLRDAVFDGDLETAKALMIEGSRAHILEEDPNATPSGGSVK